MFCYEGDIRTFAFTYEMGKKSKDSLPLLVQLSVSKEDSETLHDTLQSLFKEAHWSISAYDRKVSPVHCTLAFYTDTRLEIAIQDHYGELEKSIVPIKVTGFAADQKCVALLVEIPGHLKVFPVNKPLHITMLLHDEAPVYSNKLIERLLQKQKTSTDFDDYEGLVQLQSPIEIVGKLEIKYK